MELLLDLFHDYFRRLHQVVLDADEEDSGREILGTVEGREASEDVEIKVVPIDPSASSLENNKILRSVYIYAAPQVKKVLK